MRRVRISASNKFAIIPNSHLVGDACSRYEAFRDRSCIMKPPSPASLVFLPPPVPLPLISNNRARPWRPKLPKNQLFNPFIPPPIRSALSGAVAETLVHLILYPLDTWKTHLHYTRPFKLHPRTFFAGAPIGLLGVALDAAVFSLVYHTLKQLTRHLPNVPASLMSAAVSSLVSTAVDSPFTLARDRIRLGLASSWRDAWSSAATQNWRGLYAGAPESVVRDVPLEAIEYGIYEGLKSTYSATKRVKPVDMLALGMITGAVTGALISPLDLVVTRCSADPRTYEGVLRTIGKVVGECGIGGVFAGAKQKILRETISSALYFCIYDSLRGEDH